MEPDTVLVVTASYDIAADYVLNALEARGTPAFRLDTDRFPLSIRASFRPPDVIEFNADGETLSGTSVKSVWYRRHVLPQLPDEMDAGLREFSEREARAFLSGVLAALPTDHWMSSPRAIAQAERKPYQLTVAERLGFRVPTTLITNDPPAVIEMAGCRQLIAKAVSSGYVTSPEGNRAIFTNVVQPEHLEELDGLPLAPVVFQELVDKVSDIRVTVVAQEVFAAEILSQGHPSSQTDWRATDDPHLPHRTHALAEETADLCRRLVRDLGLVYGAIDLALLEDDTYVFFEINPNGEWLWLEDQLGFPISDTILLQFGGCPTPGM